MSDFNPQGQDSIVSVTDKVRPVAIGAPVSAIYFLGNRAAFVGDEENIVLVASGGEKSEVAVHGGAILCSASHDDRIVTGGDDGKVVALDAKGEHAVLATDAKRRWIDNVAVHPDGAIASSAGKTAFVRAPKGDEKSLDAPSTVGGLAFAPKGLRLAVAHYNGVTLWFPNMAAKPERLEWAGSHLGVTFSSDNKFLVTTMQPALHGWRLADARHMRMTGYPGRVRSMSWSAGGKGLATSGADTVIVWPFASKDGPMGKEPGMLAPLQARVTAVACHPKQDILAAGYDNGTVLMVRLTDGAEILVHRNGGAPVAALAWNAKGTTLAFAAQDGDAGLLDLEHGDRSSRFPYCSLSIAVIRGFPWEQRLRCAVGSAKQFAVNFMAGNERGLTSTNKRRALARRDLMMASAIVAFGLVISGVSMMQLAHGQTAQVTQPQTTPVAPAGNQNGPAEARPGGTRPTTPAPEPARPDADAQKAGAAPALPPAPAEKVAPPIKAK